MPWVAICWISLRIINPHYYYHYHYHCHYYFRYFELFIHALAQLLKLWQFEILKIFLDLVTSWMASSTFQRKHMSPQEDTYLNRIGGDWLKIWVCDKLPNEHTRQNDHFCNQQHLREYRNSYPKHKLRASIPYLPRSVSVLEVISKSIARYDILPYKSSVDTGQIISNS